MSTGLVRRARPRGRACGPAEQGFALAVALLAMLLLAAVGAALLLATDVEMLASSRYRSGVEAEYAAVGALDRSLAELRDVPDFSVLLGSADNVRSAAVSTFSSAPLLNVIMAGPPVDLARATQALNCPQVVPTPSSCSPAQQAAATAVRPWGPNNPVWRLYAWGALADVLPGRIDSACLTAVWVADDPGETDGDPAIDSAEGSPGGGTILVRADAFGADGTRRAVEATVAHGSVAGTLRVIDRQPVR